MKQLVGLLESVGCRNIRTYIQSGNAVFQAMELDRLHLAEKISNAIETSYGFKPKVLLLDIKALRKAIRSNPFPEAESEPKSLSILFLAAKPSHPDLQKMAVISTPTERFELKGCLFYLHTPDGAGRSRLAARAEKLLGVPATGRNWRTVCKLMQMADDKNSD
jgi:uncharacterized protein (DUF1697 family)